MQIYTFQFDIKVRNEATKQGQIPFVLSASLILIIRIRMKINIIKRTAAKKNSLGIPPVAMFTKAFGAGDFLVVSILVESA